MGSIHHNKNFTDKTYPWIFITTYNVFSSSFKKIKDNIFSELSRQKYIVIDIYK